MDVFKYSFKISTKWKIAIAIFLILFAYNFPNFYGFIKPPNGKVYLGQVSWFDPWDINVYVSAILWSQEHGFFSQNPYTTQPHKSIILYPLYTILGVAFPNQNPFLLYHLLTLFAGFLLLLTIYKTAEIFLDHKKWKLLALFLIPIAGGVGWLFYPILPVPDFYLPSFTFVATFQKAHEGIAVSLYFISLTLFFLSFKRNSTLPALLSAITACFFVFFYPFYLLSFYLICGFNCLYYIYNKREWKYFKYILTVLLITLPVGISYSLYLASTSAYSNVFLPSLPTPSPLLLPLGYGVLTPLIVLSLHPLRKRLNNNSVFLLIWFFVSAFLAYLPTGFGRYYLRGLFFPAIILSLNYINELTYNLKQRLIKILLLLLPMTSLIMTVVRTVSVFGFEDEFSKWIYIDKKEYEAISYLSRNSNDEEGVISDYYLSNLIPAHAGNRVYMGHFYQTPNSQKKIANINKFFRNEFNGNESKFFLESNNIKYVVFGPEEKEIAKESGNSSFNYPDLELVFENEEVSIFKLKS